MKRHPDIQVSPLRRQAADVLRRARKLPIGRARNDLRQLAVGLSMARKKRATSNDPKPVRPIAYNKRYGEVAALSWRLLLYRSRVVAQYAAYTVGQDGIFNRGIHLLVPQMDLLESVRRTC
jgi:hypothetical protein